VCVSVCEALYILCEKHIFRIILWSMASLAVTNIPHYLIKSTIVGKKVIEHEICVLKFLYNKTNKIHQFHKFILSRNSTCFGQFVCPSSAVYSLYTRHWYMLYRFEDSFRAGPGWNCSYLHTVHTVQSSSAQKPCLPHQQDIIPYVVKISVLRSWRWANVCPKHVELIVEINKTVIVASSWCSISLYLQKNFYDARSHERKMCFDILYKFLWNIFHLKKTSARYYHKRT
jgi:hypothetical protein